MAKTSARWNVSAAAAELHADALVWDMTLPIITPGRDELRQRVYSRYVRAGFDVASITVSVDSMDFAVTMQALAQQRRFVQEERNTCVLAESVDDIVRARASARLAVTMHFQGTDAFEDNLMWVEIFYRLGVRHALMAYNETNRVGCGCHVANDTGLTDFGRRLIGEMNRIGMIVDCAHTGYRTTMETIDACEGPVIISHTNVHALCNHPRCARDDQIAAIAAKGGVVGITGINVFLGGDATPQRFADHVDHVANLVGPEHVGLALDYVYDLETFSAFVAGLPDRYPAEAGYGNVNQLCPEDGPSITAELLHRGYSEGDIRGFLGENWLRVCRQVWK